MSPEGEAMDVDGFFRGGGIVGARMRDVDWARTPLGRTEGWPQSLTTSLSICLSSRIPIVIFWGPDLALLYNDAYVTVLGKKHPQALGQPGLHVWSEIRDVIEPMLRGVMESGDATWSEDLMLAIQRADRPEESYFTFTYSPIRGESGEVEGVFCAVIETTERVLEERRLRLLNALAKTTTSKTARDACALAAEHIARARDDVPFALLYLFDEASSVYELAGVSNLEPGTEMSPLSIRAGDRSPWPLGARAIAKLDRPVREVSEVAILPIDRAGFLVAGLSPLLSKSPSYERFHTLLASSIAQAIANAVAYDQERRRAEALAEIDRAKTDFFSNVSHEFRTPLTLILGPMEEALSAQGGVLGGADLETAHRNVLRLSKLVNTLLDFSRIESGRAQAAYEQTDLAAFTGELASVFRSAIEHAGLRFVVALAPTPEDVYVDRDMWEKVVLNLLSNALKFTFSGEIAISLTQSGSDAVLVVADTGTGVPASEVPHLFERFHRVRGARARTHEGTGIGLALVAELVRLHGGSIGVESEEGRGSRFEVRIPRGAAHLPKDRVVTGGAAPRAVRSAAPFVEEAMRWLPDVASPETSTSSRERILLADDNADMRAYVSRLLRERWDVEAVGDGRAALEAMRRHPPHLVLSDVMMPELDGFALLSAIRADDLLREIPVILVSARAGEEATAEGLRSGADDYLVKPFTARELFARITAKLAGAKSVRALKESAVATARLHRLGSLFLSEPSNLEPILLEIVDAAIDITGADFGNIQLLDPATSDLRIVASRGFPQWWLEFWDTVAAGQGTCGTALARRERVVVDDVEASPIFVGRPALDVQRRAGVRAVISTPLFTRTGQALGMFSAHFRAVHRPSQETLRHLDLLARQAADIVEHARAEEALRRSEGQQRALADERGMLVDRLEDAVRFAEQFVGILGHDLRNPLHAIQMAASHAKRSSDPDVQRRSLDRVLSSSARMTNMVAQLLDLTRSRLAGGIVLDRSATSLEVVVANAVDELRLIHPERTVRTALAASVRGEWDAERLGQVVSNLVDNAIQHGDPDRAIEVRLTAEDEEATLRVQSFGPPIAAALLPVLFDPYRRGERGGSRSNGLGLGLYISKQIVLAHGGSIDVTSNGEDGTTFTVRLPTRETRADRGREAPRTSADYPAQLH